MQRQLLERAPKESKCFPGLLEKVKAEPVETPAKKGKGKAVEAAPAPAPAPDAGKKKQKKKDVI
jgi:hypothetical protein